MSNVNDVIVKLENLTKIYKLPKGQTVTAIKNINLDIHKGDIFGIIGLSGAGKSTLIRCINYLEIPTEGDVYFKGVALGSLTNKELREFRIFCLICKNTQSSLLLQNLIRQ